MFGLARPWTLHRHAERVQSHIGRRLARFPRRRPLRLRLHRMDHSSFFLLRPQPLAGRLRATQHRRCRQPHSRKAFEHILRRVHKRQQRSRQTHQRHQPRTDLVHQPQDVVIGNETLLAPAAVVIGPLDLHLPMDRQHPPLLIRVELRRILAVWTGYAAPYVPLFFRLATLACRTALANFCPASRNSKSMAPNSSASGTSTARSTIWRTVSSILGRSSFMMASIRCSRVSLAAAGRERVDMATSRSQQSLWISKALPAYHETQRISHPSNSCTPDGRREVG